MQIKAINTRLIVSTSWWFQLQLGRCVYIWVHENIRITCFWIRIIHFTAPSLLAEEKNEYQENTHIFKAGKTFLEKKNHRIHWRNDLKKVTCRWSRAKMSIKQASKKGLPRHSWPLHQANKVSNSSFIFSTYGWNCSWMCFDEMPFRIYSISVTVDYKTN